VTRVLLLGATGFLGSHLLDRLPASFEVVTPAARFDAARPDSLAPLLDLARADVIVNAVGAKPPAAETLMDAVNGAFPHALASLAAVRGARVVHISTDGVFSGRRGHYREDDAPDPADAYGRSKVAGEIAAPHLTLRTTFFGRNPRGTGLIDWLASARGAVDGFADYRFSGVAAPLLADLVAVAIARRLDGIYHVGGEAVSKADLLEAAAARLALDVKVNRTMPGAVDRTLDSSRFFAATGRTQPTVADSINALVTCRVLSRS